MFTVSFRRPFKKGLNELTEIQIKVVQIVKKNPTFTMEQIGEAIGVGRTSVYKIVKSLKEYGILERKGRKSDGEWVVKM